MCNSPLGGANLRYRSESSEETFNGARHASPMAATMGEFSLLPVGNGHSAVESAAAAFDGWAGPPSWPEPNLALTWTWARI